MKLSGRRLPSLWLAGCLMAAGCKKEEEGPPHPAAELPAPEDAPAQPSGPPAGTIPREGEAAARPPVHVVLPGDGGTRAPLPGQPGEEAAPEAPAADAPSTPPPAPADAAALPPEDLRNREWTAGVVDLKRRPARPVTLRSVRAGQHEGFDRVVFEFDGAWLPGYHLEYIDKPIIQCGSGDPVPVAGQGWLQVRLTPAQAHTEAGKPTVAGRELKPGLPILLELERTCDFEGEVTWVLGNKSPHRYRVMELREPTRLVVDVQH